MKPKLNEDIDDKQLVKKIIETNDTHIFAVLYDRYSDVVYNKCLSFTQNREEAQDVTHDVFIHLFLKLKTFKGDSKFSTWLYSITYNFCLNYVQRNKKKRKEKFVLTDEIYPNTEEYDEMDDKQIYQVKSDNMSKALKLIDPNDKMILMMKYQDNLSIKKIQETLKLENSAIKMRLNRAKQRLMETYNTL